MTDDDLKKIKGLLKESLQPLQGEVARLTTENIKIADNFYLLRHEVSKNGQETARLSSDIENMQDYLGKELGQINNKLDALTADVVDLQDKAGATKDQLIGINDKLEENKKTIHHIKKHVGLPLN